MKWLKKWKNLTGIDQGIIEDENLGPIDNSDLVLLENVWKLESDVFVKTGLVLGWDYEILPPKAWEFFKEKFGVLEGSEIARKSIEITLFETQVEITYKPLNILIVNKSEIVTESPVLLYVSRKDSIKQIKKYIRDIYEQKTGSKPDKEYIRLWKLTLNLTNNQLNGLIKKDTAESPGSLLDDKRIISEAEIADEDKVLVEIRDDNDNWVFKSPEKISKVKCQCCRQPIYGSYIKCPCDLNSYCDKKCLEDDYRYHKCSGRYSNNNSTAKVYNQAPRIFTRNESSRLGLCGLQNLGNTCFMNSGLQCVSNSFALTQFFLDDSYKADLNKNNPLGTSGELVEEYANLIKEMWYSNSSYVSPWRFKKALSQFAPQFSGYNQQDSQEMLSFLLDGIHEDLNRVKQKPYVEEVKVNGLSDDAAARMFWEAHEMRNQSVIVDYMHGQYRSEVICPKCSNVSLTFDPFLMLTLPIPTKEEVAVEVFFVPYNCSLAIQKVKVLTIRKYTINDLRREMAVSLAIEENSINFALVSGQSFEKFLQDDTGKNSNAWLFAYEIPPLKENETVVIVEFSRESSYSSYNQSVFVGYPRVICIDKSLNLEQVHFCIYLFTLKTQGANFNSEDSSLLEKFRNSFPSIISNGTEDLYKLNLINLSKKRNSYYTSTYKPCPYCTGTKCNNCNLPYTEETLQEYVAKAGEACLKLEIFFSKNTPQQSLLRLNTTEIHESYHSASKAHQAQKDAKVSISDCLNLFRTPEQLDENNTS